jgi:hypothetical protein
MSSTLDVNLWRRWDARRDVWEGWKHYMYHKSSPLFIMKMPKIEPILKLLKSSFIISPQGIPPIVDCYVLNIGPR